ncbi:uncharacterized protein QC763_0114340 [Podospora pseudopauciseta]|uniref:Uncharacterized protein n=1 Tax=Podospora pseudopauciseta TaxID=2093780 RepID=A0ABR0GZK2_9PEZI|nr:hypothetical protein QC763_0114340 [Podospora pseudopauciseta]
MWPAGDPQALPHCGNSNHWEHCKPTPNHPRDGEGEREG